MYRPDFSLNCIKFGLTLKQWVLLFSFTHTQSSNLYVEVSVDVGVGITSASMFTFTVFEILYEHLVPFSKLPYIATVRLPVLFVETECADSCYFC